jgi:hypothetical protein
MDAWIETNDKAIADYTLFSIGYAVTRFDYFSVIL